MRIKLSGRGRSFYPLLPAPGNTETHTHGVYTACGVPLLLTSCQKHTESLTALRVSPRIAARTPSRPRTRQTSMISPCAHFDPCTVAIYKNRPAQSLPATSGCCFFFPPCLIYNSRPSPRRSFLKWVPLLQPSLLHLVGEGWRDEARRTAEEEREASL